MKKLKVKAFSVFVAGALLSLGFVMPSTASATVPDVNELLSVDSSRIQGNDNAYTANGASASGDGRYIVFYSGANNLIPSDTNSANDVFLRDRTNNTTTRVSVSSTGTQSDGSSASPRISYDGRFVVFISSADNLVTGVTGSNNHIYVHDMQTGTTTIADTSSSGTVANSGGESPGISADGRFVVFDTYASNLVSGIGGGNKQVYIKDMATGAIKALSITSGGSSGNGQSENPTISCDGGVVAFDSGASNLVSGDTNNQSDIFVDSLGWSGNQLADVTLTGNNGSDTPSISCNGNEVAYNTYATNLAPSLPSSSQSVLEYNRLTGGIAVVSADSGGTPASGESLDPSVSDDGRYVAFLSYATTGLDSSRSYYLPGDFANTFIRDMKEGTTQVLSIDLAGDGAGYSDHGPTISADGSIVVYDSSAENTPSHPQNGLVSSDSNGHIDVFDSETGF